MGRNQYFQFKQFRIEQQRSAMKVGIDGVLLGAWADVTAASKILDVGTGTGLIALMMAQRSNGEITGIEIDQEAAGEAGYNARQSLWSERITILHTSFQTLARQQAGKYDLIVSNPPFFGSGTKASSEKRAAARHNDKLPLPELIWGCSRLLAPGGKIALVLPASEEATLIQLAEKKQLKPCRILRVQPNPIKPPHRILIELDKHSTSCLAEELTIEGTTHLDYTDEYRRLTSDFYPAF